LEVDVLHVELSVPGPHPVVGVDCELGRGVPPVLLLGFVVFPTGLNAFEEVLRLGNVPVLLLGFVALLLCLEVP